MASNVSDKKSAENLIEDALYVISHFSFASFRFLSLSLFFNSLIISVFWDESKFILFGSC